MPDSNPQATGNSEASRDVEREERDAERFHQKVVEAMKCTAAVVPPAIAMIVAVWTGRR